MRSLKIFVLSLFLAALVLQISFFSTARVEGQSGASEAPTGFDNLTNGFIPQAQFDQDRDVFAEVEDEEEGLGPLFNSDSCGQCHQNPVTGGISQITELRAGHYDGANFIDHPGGSLINDRSIAAEIQELVIPGNEVQALRASLTTLGDGFVECIADQTLIDIASSQPTAVRGTVIMVPVFEAGGALRVGRFGWKNQQASLVSFSADAYLNEMGITSPLLPTENTSNGASVKKFDEVPDPEDTGGINGFGEDVEAFARFMRATKASPRSGVDGNAGEAIFNSIGCAVCHTPTIVTAAPGTVINGGTFIVPDALGNKTIHPFSDFLLHDIGTGDGIVQNGGQGTRNKLRTAPLWGVRTRTRLLHDGRARTFNDAILQHANQAASSVTNYTNLSTTQRNQLLKFLGTL